MTNAAAKTHPVETGGILIGVHVDGHPWVITAVEIATADRGRSHFRIPGGADHAAVLTARSIDDRLGYLGDWHSHPHDIGHSPTDLASLALISIKKPRDPNPTQIVLRRTESGYTLDARRIVTLVPRACTVTLTGGLPGLTPPTEKHTGPGIPGPRDPRRDN